MNYLEITKKCAEAVGAKEDVCNGEHHWHFPDGNYMIFSHWNPLKDDAQVMALLHWLRERGEIIICPTIFVFKPLRASRAIEGSKMRWEWVGLTTDEMHRRAICECVAKMGT